MFVLAVLMTTSVSAQATNPDETAIRGVIAQFSAMWTTPEGLAIFRNIASDHYTNVMGGKVYNREEFSQFVTGILQNNQIVKHTHTVQRIQITNDIAYEYGIIEFVTKNGQTTKSENMNIFIREQSGWRLLFSAPPAPESN